MANILNGYFAITRFNILDYAFSIGVFDNFFHIFLQL